MLLWVVGEEARELNGEDGGRAPFLFSFPTVRSRPATREMMQNNFFSSVKPSWSQCLRLAYLFRYLRPSLKEENEGQPAYQHSLVFIVIILMWCK
jgi:hypothetical protein